MASSVSRTTSPSSTQPRALLALCARGFDFALLLALAFVRGADRADGEAGRGLDGEAGRALEGWCALPGLLGLLCLLVLRGGGSLIIITVPSDAGRRGWLEVEYRGRRYKAPRPLRVR